jgi:hypothetical protein
MGGASIIGGLRAREGVAATAPREANTMARANLAAGFMPGKLS